MTKRMNALGWAVLMMALAVACAKPAQIKINPAKVLLFDAGGTKAITVTVLDQKGGQIENPKVKFSTSNQQVADVDSSGKITANGSGDAVVTASIGALSATVPVTVRIASSLKLEFTDKAQTETGVQGPTNAQVPLLVSGSDDAGKPADLSVATFLSSDPRVATIDQHGVLTIFSSGTTEVSVSMGKTRAALSVPVKILVPMAIKLDSPNLSVKPGQSAPIPFSVISDAGSTLSMVPAFTSSDAAVAKVDGNGVVTGLSRGSATISIKAGEASNVIQVSVR